MTIEEKLSELLTLSICDKHSSIINKKDNISDRHKHYKKTELSQRFQNRWDSPKKRWDRVKIPIPAFFFPALQTVGQ